MDNGIGRITIEFSNGLVYQFDGPKVLALDVTINRPSDLISWDWEPQYQDIIIDLKLHCDTKSGTPVECRREFPIYITSEANGQSETVRCTCPDPLNGEPNS